VSYRASLPLPVLEAGSGVGKAGGSGFATDTTESISGAAFRERRFLLLLCPEVGMAKVEKITVALSEDTLSAVRDAVASGEYASTSEVVRDALRDWKVKHRLSRIELDEMRRLVREGADSGPGIDADLVFARLRAKYAASAQE